MKHLLLVALALSAPLYSAQPPHTEGAFGSPRANGQNGFIQNALSAVVGSAATATELAIAQTVAVPLAKHEQELVEKIVAGVAAANQAQIKPLEAQMKNLEAKIDAQNKGCCSIQ